MKQNLNKSILITAIAISGCTAIPKTTNAYQGRVIEYKSGIEGFDTKTFFYEGQNEVIAFDAQFTEDLAKNSIEHLRKFTNKPITKLVITHPNPDKFNGASVFKKHGATIIASTATARAIPEVHKYKKYYFVELAKMFTNETYPEVVAVDQTFEDETELQLEGGESIQLKELSQPGVSSTQSVAYIKSANALIVGDLIHYQAHAWLEGGIINGQPKPTIDGWIADVNELAALYPPQSIVYGGRGDSTTLHNAVAAQIEYLKKAESLIHDQLKLAGLRTKDITMLSGSNFYQNLTAKFQAQFPKYALPYMIDYGSYGLVQSILMKMN